MNNNRHHPPVCQPGKMLNDLCIAEQIRETAVGHHGSKRYLPAICKAKVWPVNAR
jgi:hypothetical protein